MHVLQYAPELSMSAFCMRVSNTMTTENCSTGAVRTCDCCVLFRSGGKGGAAAGRCGCTACNGRKGEVAVSRERIRFCFGATLIFGLFLKTFPRRGGGAMFTV